MECLLIVGLIFLSGGISATTTVGPCVDKLTECSRLGYVICSDPNYVVFVKENCCKHCLNAPKQTTVTSLPTVNRATSTANLVTGSKICTDVLDNCATFGTDVCSEPSFVQWAFQKCAKTCNLCNGIPSTIQPITTTPLSTIFSKVTTSSSTDTCVDAIDNCIAFGRSSCTSYPNWAKDKCAKYCDLCKGNNQHTTVEPVTKDPTGTSCTDMLHDCKNYGASICSDHKYTQWTRHHCAKYCNMCTPGCYYHNKIYKEKETFKDGCKLKCTCNNADTGAFTCGSMCYTWNLPAVCTMEPPKAGKCCPTPKCPANVILKYPVGYTED